MMNYKLVELSEQDYAGLFINHKPGAEPYYTPLCKASGNIILIAAATERGLILDLPLCTRPISKRWASVEWQYSAPGVPGINPLASWARMNGYESVSDFSTDYGLTDW